MAAQGNVNYRNSLNCLEILIINQIGICENLA